MLEAQNIHLRRNFLYNQKLKLKARELRNNMTVAERKLWFEYLRSFPVKVYRQKPLGNYIVDFYVPSLKLIIEVDGGTHIEINEIKYDDDRTKFLESMGLRVIRFWNYQILKDFEAVCVSIQDYLEKINPPNPLY